MTRKPPDPKVVRDQLSNQLGLTNPNLHIGLSQPELFQHAIRGDKGRVSFDGPEDQHKARVTSLGEDGPLVFYSDPDCTGRPVQDTYAVAWPELIDKIWWKPDFAQFPPSKFDSLLGRVVDHLNETQNNLFVTDVFCGWDENYSLPYRFVGEYASLCYFANIMFPKSVRDDNDRHEIGWTMLNVPSFKPDPERDGTRSDRAVIMDIKNRIALVLGAADYAGVVKKTMFTVMNFVMPNQGQLPMHCAANLGPNNDSAILFGLSGTGKTTLSADPNRLLIGDDEHVWSDAGVSNFEDGCYAKLINLDKENEPVIANALTQPGTFIENVPAPAGKDVSEIHPNDFDLSDGSRTENTRFAYPITCNPRVAPGSSGPHPETIVLLTADAFGVLPPISILTQEEVMYHFVMGFTSKLAGTEVGVTEPQATFSCCFGAPFMSHKPMVYAELLAKRMTDHKARCVLLNTGWSGGAYGVGSRMPLKMTRQLLNAALSGELDGTETKKDPIFGLSMPLHVDGVDSEMLDPKKTWADGDEYDRCAKDLAELFRAHYAAENYQELGIPNLI